MLRIAILVGYCFFYFGGLMAQDLGAVYAKSLSQWQALRTAANGTYNYTLYEVRYEEKKRLELQIWVEQNKVSRTELTTYDLRTEKSEVSQKKQHRNFMDMPVGTLDDVYAFIEQTWREMPEISEYIMLETNHLQLLAICGYYPEGQLSKPFKGYFIKNIAVLPEQQNQWYNTWQAVEVWELDSNKIAQKIEEPTQLIFYSDGHFTFKQKTAYCYEYYSLDLLKNTFAVNQAFDPAQHYECEGLKTNLIDKTYLEAVRFEWRTPTELWLYAPLHALRLLKVD
jgi:hypothetical protein